MPGHSFLCMCVTYYLCITCRILKQALRGSGANLTMSHLTMMSLCGLFLLDTAKKVDEQFQTPHRSSHHTVRDAAEDVMKMTCYLLEEKVACERERGGVEFKDPLKMGAKKIASGYIENFLKKTEVDDDIEETSEGNTTVQNADFSYELYHTN